MKGGQILDNRTYYYARVSSTEQNLDRQLEAFKNEKYKNYCNAKGYVPYKTQQEFTGNLKKLLGNTARFKKIRIGDENKNGIIGLAFRE